MSLQSIDFSPQDQQEQHDCTAQRQGDWIIFRCEHCPDYERRLNWKTGEMKTKGQDNHILHQGHYLPIGIAPEQFNLS